MSPRHQTCSTFASSTAARTASRACRLEWMSLRTATRKAGSVPGFSLGPYDGPVTATDSIAALRSAVEGAARTLHEADASEPRPTLERPPKPELGDYSSNAAMLLARHLSDNPRTVAEKLRGELEADAELAPCLERIEVAGPGFVNFYLADSWYLRALGTCWRRRRTWGPQRPRRRRRSWSSSSPPTRPDRST